MGIINQRFGLPWITACVAASLFAVSSGSIAQDAGKRDAAEKSQSEERSEKSGKSDDDTVTARLSGDKEVPPVQTNGSGQSTIKVDENGSVSGKVTVDNFTPTAAHIHQGPPDKAGPVIIPLNKTSKNTFSVPAKTKLTDDQFAAFKDGNLYINVHSKKYPGGEVRAQMKP